MTKSKKAKPIVTKKEKIDKDLKKFVSDAKKDFLTGGDNIRNIEEKSSTKGEQKSTKAENEKHEQEIKAANKKVDEMIDDKIKKYKGQSIVRFDG